MHGAICCKQNETIIFFVILAFIIGNFRHKSWESGPHVPCVLIKWLPEYGEPCFFYHPPNSNIFKKILSYLSNVSKGWALEKICTVPLSPKKMAIP